MNRFRIYYELNHPALIGNRNVVSCCMVALLVLFSSYQCNRESGNEQKPVKQVFLDSNGLKVEREIQRAIDSIYSNDTSTLAMAFLKRTLDKNRTRDGLDSLRSIEKHLIEKYRRLFIVDTLNQRIIPSFDNINTIKAKIFDSNIFYQAILEILTNQTMTIYGSRTLLVSDSLFKIEVQAGWSSNKGQLTDGLLTICFDNYSIRLCSPTK